jgi:hypothetical protein
MSHALSHLRSSRRESSSVEIEPFDWVMNHMAWNQVVSGTRLWAKMVPALSEVCRPQA